MNALALTELKRKTLENKFPSHCQSNGRADIRQTSVLKHSQILKNISLSTVMGCSQITTDCLEAQPV